MFVLFKPGDIKSLYTEEERIPKLPGWKSICYLNIGFDVFEYSRRFDLKFRFKGTRGLITNSVSSLPSHLSVLMLVDIAGGMVLGQNTGPAGHDETKECSFLCSRHG